MRCTTGFSGRRVRAGELVAGPQGAVHNTKSSEAVQRWRGDAEKDSVRTQWSKKRNHGHSQATRKC